MRALALLGVVLAGCGAPSGECKVDSDCGGGQVCARNSECLAASAVRAVRVTWTIRGAPASDTTCAQTPSFYVLFSSPDVNDTYGYEPVPCKAGLFSVDKLPTRFNAVELGVENRFAETAAFDANGNAALDLFP